MYCSDMVPHNYHSDICWKLTILPLSLNMDNEFDLIFGQPYQTQLLMANIWVAHRKIMTAFLEENDFQTQYAQQQ